MLQTAGMHRLDGKIALVTGAARGTGAAIARRFVAEGARVVLADVLDEPGRAVAAELGDAARFVHLDVTDEDAWSRVVDDIAATEGALHVLVNNAAVLHLATIDATATDAFERVMRVNVLGPFLGIRTLPAAAAGVGLGRDRQRRFDRLGAGRGADRRVHRVEVRAPRPHEGGRAREPKRGVRANIVCPMLGNPEMHPADRRHRLRTDAARRRQRRPDLDVIAEAVCYFASDEIRFTTGTELVLDGGHSAGLALDLPDAWFDPRLCATAR